MVTARITCCIEESGNPYGRSARRKPQQTPPGFYAATKYAGTYIVIVSGKPKRNITLDNAYELASFSVDEGWILEEWPEWEDPDVKYWIPLPEPPKEVICDE